MIKVKTYYNNKLILENNFRSEKSCEKFLKQIEKGRRMVYNFSVEPKIKVEITKLIS